MLSLIAQIVGLAGHYIKDKGQLEKYQAELIAKAAEGEFQLLQKQVEVNVMDAQSGHWYQSYWRPTVAWICTISLGLNILVLPLTKLLLPVILPILAVFGIDPMPWHIQDALTPIDMELQMTMLLGLLGLGYFRSLDKKIKK